MPIHVLLAGALWSLSVTNPERRQPAGCTAALEFIATSLEVNYPGYRDKVTPATRAAYDAHRRDVAARAARAVGDLECLPVLHAFVAFYQDRHINVGYAGAIPPSPQSADTSVAAIRSRYAAAPRRELKAADSTGDPMLGTWDVIGTGYRLLVMPDSSPDKYVAVVVRADSVWWMPGQIKAWLTRRTDGSFAVLWHQRDHSEQRGVARRSANLLTVSEGASSTWLRVAPAMSGDLTLDEYRASLNTRLRFERLSERSVAIHIPSFNPNQARALDSLLAARKTDIESAENLIIDLRGNGGGSDFVYGPLLPLLAAGPLVRVPHGILSTAVNRAKFEQLAADATLPDNERRSMQRLVDTLRAHDGELLVNRSDTIRFAKILETPRRVALLVDRGCASSCEQFVLMARQSAKVTTYGDNTAGIVDYGNVHSIPDPENRFRLFYPTSRSQRLPAEPIDPAGIPPQFRVPGGEARPIEWLRRRLDADPPRR